MWVHVRAYWLLLRRIEGCGSPSSHAVVEVAVPASSCDMAEELSRQLEDILSTYCQEDSGEDGALPEAPEACNGQPDGLEVNGVADKEDSKPEEPKVNGTVVEKDQKKMQEKKKVKGLGRFLLQYLVSHFVYLCVHTIFASLSGGTAQVICS